jgi:phosphatidate cytidylyltransferase
LPDDDHALRAGAAAPLIGAGPSNLTLRVASAAVLAPVAVATAYWGGWPFIAFWALASIGVFWEWIELVLKQTPARDLPRAIAASLMDNRRLWVAGGLVYAGAAFFGPVLLRRDTEYGFSALMFLFAVVWATDILAYFTGRAFGGPLLWARVSPKKTWSGALGGLIGAGAAGIAVAYGSGIGNLAAIAILALLLSVLSQAGDLFESAVKRRFAAKDASGLIPGHGGVMDRLDGFMVAALAAAVIGIVRQGFDAPAHGLLLW